MLSYFTANVMVNAFLLLRIWSLLFMEAFGHLDVTNVLTLYYVRKFKFMFLCVLSAVICGS